MSLPSTPCTAASTLAIGSSAPAPPPSSPVAPAAGFASAVPGMWMWICGWPSPGSAPSSPVISVAAFSNASASRVMNALRSASTNFEVFVVAILESPVGSRLGLLSPIEQTGPQRAFFTSATWFPTIRT
ncbi:hypothetical protein [Burkholderia glumae]|uniref:hypothetical protein n=1 Tax=Burkholderia glumae TaxID=337 RepID=UPI001F17FDC4|nr:hypothetical protein [Burkholderia glumae]